MGIKDSMNMGCAMAPAAADLIRQHLEDFGRTEQDYDLIITGDLGKVGSQALVDLLLEQNIDISKKHMDCGMLIYDIEAQDVGAGGSGCGCSAAVLCSTILPKIWNKEYRNILFIATGALMSTVSIQQGESIPSIAHLLWLQS